MLSPLKTREDYIHFVEVLYFGAMRSGDYGAVLEYFSPGAVLTGYAGDAPARLLTRVPGPGQSSLDDFMSATRQFDLTYKDFEHVVDVTAQRIASYFTLLIEPKPDAMAQRMPSRLMRNCNFFEFQGNRLISVTAYFANPGGATAADYKDRTRTLREAYVGT